MAAAVLVVAPFALGSAPRWAACLSSALAVAAAIPYARSSRASIAFSPLLLFLLLAVGLTTLQLLPLPAGLVEIVSPERYALAADNAKAWGESAPSFIALSYDSPATLLELAKLCAYAAFAYTCVRIAASSRGRVWLCTTVALVAVALSLTALVHIAADAKSLFGIYHPYAPKARSMTPFLNPSHLAGFLAFATPLALGLAIASSKARRIAWAAAAALCAGTALFAQSRAGAIALVFGIALTSGMLLVQRRRGAQPAGREKTVASAIPAGIVALCLLVLLGAFTAGDVLDKLGQTSATRELEHGKFTAWQASATLIYEHPWTGTGRGAFEYAFTRVSPLREVTFSDLENEYLQAVVDWGIPAAAGLAIALILVAVTAAQRWRAGPLEAAALGGLSALALHNAADFNLELPGVALPAIAVLAVVAPLRASRRVASQRKLPPRIKHTLSLAAAGLICIAAMTPWGRTARADSERLQAQLDQKTSPASDLVDEAHAMMRRHPSDYVTAGLAARALMAARDRRAPAVMNRALAMNPRHDGLHHLAAQLLVEWKQKQQALVEYALTLHLTSNPKPILEELLRVYDGDPRVVRGLPLDPDRAPGLANATRLLGQGKIALAYLDAVIQLYPDDRRLLIAGAKLALLQRDVQRAVTWSTRAHALRADLGSALVLGRALRAAGKREEAETLLVEASGDDRFVGDKHSKIQVLDELADIQIELGKYHSAHKTASDVLALAGSDPDLRAAAHRKLSKIEEKLGNANQATWERGRADELLSQ